MPLRLVSLFLALLLHTSPTWRGGVCPGWLTQAFSGLARLCESGGGSCCSEGCEDRRPSPCIPPSDGQTCPCFVECSASLPIIKTERTTAPEIERTSDAWPEPWSAFDLRASSHDHSAPPERGARAESPPRSILCVWII